MTTLIACSHGTADRTGTAAVRMLVDAVAERGIPVSEAFVDIHGPFIDDVVAAIRDDAVVVPLLLSAGFHVHVDIAASVRPWPTVLVAPTLGPDQRITEIVVDRMKEAGIEAGDLVVLAAAGSSDPRAADAVQAVAQSITRQLGITIHLAYGSSREPRLNDEILRLRALHPGRRVAAVSYLLATGHFHRRVIESGADLITAPLLDAGPVDPRLVELVVERYASMVDSHVGARDEPYPQIAGIYT